MRYALLVREVAAPIEERHRGSHVEQEVDDGRVASCDQCLATVEDQGKDDDER